MALGFIKKVFSFGRREEPKPETPAPEAIAPDTNVPDLAAAEAVGAEPAPATASVAAREIAQPEVLAESTQEALPPAKPEIVPELAPEGAPEPEAEAAPAPVVTEIPPAAAESDAVATEDVAKAAAAVEPAPAVAEPVDESPAEVAVKPAKAGEAPSAEPPAVAELPVAEVAPPIRQPSPVEPDPLVAEIAPEPQPVPAAPLPPVETTVSAERSAAAVDMPETSTETVAQTPPAPTSAAPIPTPPPAARVTVAKSVEAKQEPAAPVPAPERLSWLQRLKTGLARTSRELTGSIAGVFTKRKLDEDTLEELEEVLLRADLGMETAIRITGALAQGRHGRNVTDEEVREIMAQEVEKVLGPVALPLELDLSHKPHVILVVGVNGTGKTTTIGKLAAKLAAGGLKVTLAAGDTFRAAAIEQLKIWGERTGSPVVSSKLGADAAGLAHDAFTAARASGSDVLIIDTAGRLQNKAELMAELEKIVRVLGKLDPEAPHTVLQTVDATTGQNALNQVEIFRNVAGVNGLVMTKLDGTARGGILVAIAAKHRLPVYFIGVGEQVDDLEPFSARDFARAIAGVA